MEGMNSTISSIVAETKSIRTDIAGFQTGVLGLEQHVTAIEDHINTARYRDQEIICLHSKLIDLDNRSCGDNGHFIGIREQAEGADIQAFLRCTLPNLTGILFNPTLEFQRTRHLGPKRSDGAS
ncbi:hypothetical protein NDU88_003064 [Pleurodeles waltl]|uniref:Uncharacterized protein n=1 Tax=Pleurodeles waltl TaxID=8319 RepID=A0AAV7WRQ6_PLEWA|nr:hypothetical protein NDU88_003064 [Pleurodeles waltl]